MDVTYRIVKDILQKKVVDKDGSESIVTGRLYTVRGNKKIKFVDVMDYSTVSFLVCVIPGHLITDEMKLGKGYTVSLKGHLVKAPDKATHSIEMQVNNIIVVSKVGDKYPLSGKEKITRDFLRTIPHLRGRTRLFQSISLIRGCMYKWLHSYFTSVGIQQDETTILTGNECESGAFPFTATILPRVDEKDVSYDKDFFHKQVYLTVSSQLHLEASVCSTLADKYCMTTAFRAEPSQTRLHMAEFCMPEWEIIAKNQFEDMSQHLLENMTIAEGLVKTIVTMVLKEHKEELCFLQQYDLDHMKEEQSYSGRLIEILTKYSSCDTFPIITHAQAVKQLQKHMEDGLVTFEEKPEFHDDFSKEHERYITEKIFNEVPVFVTEYPQKIKAFYMPVTDESKEEDIPRVHCYDLLFPYIGEVVGGSQRIHDYDELLHAMQMFSVSTDDLSWYLDLRRHSTVPHGGAGIGLNRLLCALTGVMNVRDMSVFPRGYGMKCFA